MIVLRHLDCFHLSLINIPLLVSSVSVFLPLCHFVFVLWIKRPAISLEIIMAPGILTPAYFPKLRLCLLPVGLFACLITN